jgi:hypothetical protein
VISSGQSKFPLVYPFNDGCVGHTAAFTHGLHSVATAVALKFVHKSRHQSSAARAQRMSEGNRAAINIDLS